MVDDNAQLHVDATAALEPAALAQQAGEVRGDQAVFSQAEQNALRAELIKGHPNAVHEMIVGNSTAEMIASVTNAEAAYHRVSAAVQAATPTGAGGGVRSEDVVNGGAGSAGAMSKLDAFSKISVGLSQNDLAGQNVVGGLGMARVNNVGRR